MKLHPRMHKPTNPPHGLLLPKTFKGWLIVSAVIVAFLGSMFLSLYAIYHLSRQGCYSPQSNDNLWITQGFLPSVSEGYANYIPANAAEEIRYLEQVPADVKPIGGPIRLSTCPMSTAESLLLRLTPDISALPAPELYIWDTSRQSWHKYSAEYLEEAHAMRIEHPRSPALLMLGQPIPRPPVIGVEIPSGPAASLALMRTPHMATEIYIEGLYLGDLGRLSGNVQQVSLSSSGGYGKTPYLKIRNWGWNGEVGRTVLRTLLSDDRILQAHTTAIASTVAAGRFNGVVIDYRGLIADQREAFSRFIDMLGEKMRKDGRSLIIVVPMSPHEENPQGSAYDLLRIGKAATRIHLDLTVNPAGLFGDNLDRLLRHATGQLDRRDIQIIIPALSLQQDSRHRVRLTPLAEAVGRIGQLRPPSSPVQAGAVFDLRWWNDETVVDAVSYSPAGRILSFTSINARGLREVTWLNTAASVETLLSRIRSHRIGGIVLRGLSVYGLETPVDPLVGRFMQPIDEGDKEAVAPEVVMKIDAFGRPSHIIPASALGDRILIDTPDSPGAYVITLSMQTNVILHQSSHQVILQQNAIGDDMASNSSLEVGGVVNYSDNLTYMTSMGMHWRRITLRGEQIPSEIIAESKQQGFKVMVSVVGDRAWVLDPGYQERWVAYLAKLANAGVDAIQIWHEPNYHMEWPSSRISGYAYTELLKRAYSAIKAANPNVMVVSAGLAQTRGMYGNGCESGGCDEVEFLRQMALANAHHYMDCIGVNYTDGSVFPSSPSGVNPSKTTMKYLIDMYASPFQDRLPLCFSTLGYLSAEDIDRPFPAGYAFLSHTTNVQQAEWIADALRLAKQDGRVRIVIIWNVDSQIWNIPPGLDDTDGFDPQAGYAILRPDGSCPSCRLIHRAIHASSLHQGNP